ncbi:MAG: hypothetical protein EBZ13_14935, partial [Planctomycetia bacterium]|nr:hypothetical protein [Planctomycetia bacterium]
NRSETRGAAGDRRNTRLDQGLLDELANRSEPDQDADVVRRQRPTLGRGTIGVGQPTLFEQFNQCRT